MTQKNEENIFDLIYEKNDEKLRLFVNSPKCDVHIVDEMQRSPIFVCFVESNYQALLVLLENPKFVDLFNSPFPNTHSMQGSYEFLHGFMSYKNPTDLRPLFPFIRNINQCDNNGMSSLHYFLFGLEGYILTHIMSFSTNPNQQKEMNQEVKKMFDCMYDSGVDFHLTLKGQSPIESYLNSDIEHASFFKSSLDYILAKLEKEKLETSLPHLIKEVTKQKL